MLMWPVARMGVGKTKILLTVLDQHFYDPRKKLPVAPKQSIISNLLDEMLHWPTKYRSYFALVTATQSKTFFRVCGGSAPPRAPHGGIRARGPSPVPQFPPGPTPRAPVPGPGAQVCPAPSFRAIIRKRKTRDQINGSVFVPRAYF